MVDNFDPTFESVDSGAALSVPIAIADIKKGTHIVLGDKRPCKVMEITTMKTGKHGHAKASIVAVDIFNGKKYEESQPVSHSEEEPLIKRTTWTVLMVNDEGYVSLVDPHGNIREDLRLPNEVDDD